MHHRASPRSTVGRRPAAPHHTAKRFARSRKRVQGRLDKKVLIPVKKTGPNDFLRQIPESGPTFEDPQGLEPFDGEDRGRIATSRKHNNQWRLMAGVQGQKLPETIPYTSRDTLYTYSQRVHRLQTRALVNVMREQEEQRIERNFVVASRQAEEIANRSQLYKDYRHRLFLNNAFNHTVRLQKHGAALAASYQRGQESQQKQSQETAERQAKYLELLLNERRTTWIEDENVPDFVFNSVDTQPTGWWPMDDDVNMYMSKFETDDQDRNEHFVTKYPAWTNIRPGRGADDLDSLYNTVSNRRGWDEEKKRLDKTNDEIFGDRSLDFDESGKFQIPPSVPQVVQTPLVLDDLSRRKSLRSGIFMQHEFDSRNLKFNSQFGAGFQADDEEAAAATAVGQNPFARQQNAQQNTRTKF